MKEPLDKIVRVPFNNNQGVTSQQAKAVIARTDKCALQHFSNLQSTTLLGSNPTQFFFLHTLVEALLQQNRS